MSGAVLLTALLFAADAKAEAPPAPVKKVVDGYLKALAARDLDAMAALADVPWLDRDRHLVRDWSGLRKALERTLAQMPKTKGKQEVKTLSYKTARGHLQRLVEDKSIKPDDLKLLDELLGDDGWVVAVSQEGYLLSQRTILIRVKGGKIAVVGGPLKENQVTPHNRLPAAVEQLLDKAETFELVSLDPDNRGKGVVAKDGFQGWKVLGKTSVKDEERKRLTAALRLSVEDNFGIAAACFIPRHGIRLKGDGKTVDLVICFECLSAQVFVDGKRGKGFLTTNEPRAAFDAVLKTAGVKLPKPAKE